MARHGGGEILARDRGVAPHALATPMALASAFSSSCCRGRDRARRYRRSCPSSPRCGGCWRRAWCRRAGSCRPRCRGIFRALRRGGRSAGDRPGLRARTRRRRDRAARPVRAAGPSGGRRRRRAVLSKLSLDARPFDIKRFDRIRLHEPASSRKHAIACTKILQLVADHSPAIRITQRRPSQRIRVLRSRRLLVDRPEADQHVDLVGERDRDRHRIGRHAIAGPSGL